jgi:hypothetical protein
MSDVDILELSQEEEMELVTQVKKLDAAKPCAQNFSELFQHAQFSLDYSTNHLQHS